MGVLYTCTVGEGTRRPSTMTVTEILFADNAAAVSTTRDGTERAAHILDEITSKWEQMMSIPKTKLMITGVQSKEDLISEERP